MPESYAIFPVLNASLNATSAVLIATGIRLIRTGRRAAHRGVMIAAVVSSTLFLGCYLYYHAHVGSVRFTGRGWIRPLYFGILLTHTILAAVVVPLVLVTLVRGLRERFDRHKAIAKWAYPIWLYVSVTGVLIYVLLYQVYA